MGRSEPTKTLRCAAVVAAALTLREHERLAGHAAAPSIQAPTPCVVRRFPNTPLPDPPHLRVLPGKEVNLSVNWGGGATEWDGELPKSCMGAG